jgi:hypothetical protein
MQRAMGKWMAGVVPMTTMAMTMTMALALAGCGNEQCDKLGEHMADLVLTEAKAAGNEVAEDKRAEIVKKTADACNAEPPSKEHLDCAVAADSTKAIKKCEGVEEDPKKG